MNSFFAAFIAAHGLIHASYLSPTPARTAGGPEWPFELGRSWLVSGLGLDAGAVRLIGTVLIAVTVTAFSFESVRGLRYVAVPDAGDPLGLRCGGMVRTVGWTG